jgi:hypothetical protein
MKMPISSTLDLSSVTDQSFALAFLNTTADD